MLKTYVKKFLSFITVLCGLFFVSSTLYLFYYYESSGWFIGISVVLIFIMFLNTLYVPQPTTATGCNPNQRHRAANWFKSRSSPSSSSNTSTPEHITDRINRDRTDNNNNKKDTSPPIATRVGYLTNSQFSQKGQNIYRKERTRNGVLDGVYGLHIGDGQWQWVYYSADDKLGFRVTR